MRVALVSITDPRDVKAWSGIPYSILSELERQVDTVEVIAPLSRWFRFLYAFERTRNRLRHQSYHLDRHPLALRSYARQIKKRMRDKNFDLVFSTSSIAIAALDTSVPVIYWTDAVLEQMIGYYTAVGTFSDRELAVCHRQEQAAIDRSTLAVYASHWAIDAVAQRYERADEKLFLGHFGANIAIHHDGAAVEGMIENRLRSPLRLLFIGVDWERKGGPIAWETVSQLNELGIPCVLQVAGCKAPEAAFVENFGFISKATKEGQERLSKLLAEATIFLFPTRAEAAGCVFAEAAAFGLPVVATDTGGVSDYVVTGENGYLLPLKAEAAEYVATVRRLLEDTELYRTISRNGFARYQSLLNWKVGVQKLLKLVVERNEARKS